MRVVVSWSGGKDSCLACYRAISDGFKVSHLLNFVSKNGTSMSHGLDSRLMVAQSQAIGIPLIQRDVTWDTYEDGFKAAMVKLKQMGVEGAVFGDIQEIPEHKDWVSRVCRDVDITPMEPLWGLNPEQILSNFIDEGFEAVVVNVRTDLLGEEWLGRKIDRSFIEDIKKLQSKHELHVCGEFGEYHTLVTDGPIFNSRIKILESRKVLRGGHWSFRLLDILEYATEQKKTIKGNEKNL